MNNDFFMCLNVNLMSIRFGKPSNLILISTSVKSLYACCPISSNLAFKLDL